MIFTEIIVKKRQSPIPQRADEDESSSGSEGMAIVCYFVVGLELHVIDVPS